jgi:hypothetical protein
LHILILVQCKQKLFRKALTHICSKMKSSDRLIFFESIFHGTEYCKLKFIDFCLSFYKVSEISCGNLKKKPVKKRQKYLNFLIPTLKIIRRLTWSGTKIFNQVLVRFEVL